MGGPTDLLFNWPLGPNWPFGPNDSPRAFCGARLGRRASSPIADQLIHLCIFIQASTCGPAMLNLYLWRICRISKAYLCCWWWSWRFYHQCKDEIYLRKFIPNADRIQYYNWVIQRLSVLPVFNGPSWDDPCCWNHHDVSTSRFSWTLSWFLYMW